MSLQSGTQLGAYEIIAPLGAGGMGEVWRARDTRLDREVAIKVLPASVAADADRLLRFAQEARAVSALNHPNIITIHEIGEAPTATGTMHFIVTELVAGRTLRDHSSASRLSLTAALEAASQIASALAAAHQAGIIHRDIKPENVMIRPDGLIKVLDFGLAKLTGKREAPVADSAAPTALTDPGTVMGTAQYMSPEQARGQEVDARTDIFSLGVLLYEMLAGRPAFAGVNALDIIGAILNQEPSPLKQHVAEAPDELQRIMSKALRKDREQRYQHVNDLLIDLKDLKQEVELAAKLKGRQAAEPVAQTESEVTPTVSLHPDPTAELTGALKDNRTTSSSKIILTEIKRHKLGVALAVGLLLIGIVAGVYFLSGRNSGAINSIAVLPFVNASGNADVEYLSDGMTETLISSLSQLPKLNVKARSSVFRYKGKTTDTKTIGKELNVQAILNGRVVQHGDQLTLSLELVDAQTENVIWSEQYNRRQADLVSLQSEIARDVSSKLKTKLSGEDEQKLTKKYTENAEAYQLYLKGLFFLNRRTSESLQKAIEYFNQAIAIDPNYALGYAGLADSYLLLGLPDAITGALSPQDSLPKAKAAAEKALQIDNSVGEVYFSLGQVKSKEHDWAGAESAFDRGLKLSPNYPIGRLYYAVYLSSLGRQDEAVKEIRRAQELDPLSLPINGSVVYVLYFGRQYDEAIVAGKKTLEMDAAFSLTHQRLGLAYVQKKMYREAIAEFQQAANNSNRAPLAIVSLGHAYAVSGNKVEAQRVLAELKDMLQRRYVSPYSMATIYAGMGEKDQAFQWLQKANGERNTELVFLKVDPRLDPLRDDPRFQELLKKVGFPQ